MDVYLGVVLPFAGDFAPRGFELCQGQELSINEFQALYAVIGDTYGGDLKTETFNLPKLQGPEASGVKARLHYIICIDGNFPSRQ